MLNNLYKITQMNQPKVNEEVSKNNNCSICNNENIKHGIVYLLQPSTLIGTKRYKVGMSEDIKNYKRLSSYGKRTRYIDIFETCNPKELENKIIDEFKKKYKLLEGTRESFECNNNKDEIHMRETFLTLCLSTLRIDKTSFEEQSIYSNHSEHEETTKTDKEEEGYDEDNENEISELKIWFEDDEEEMFEIKKDEVESTTFYSYNKMTDKFNTHFKQDLVKKLQDKSLSEKSIKLYVRNLEKLNDNMPIKNLNFLKDVSKTLDKLKDKKPNTIRAYLISISVSLSVIKGENKVLNKLFDDFNKSLRDIGGEIRNSNNHDISEDKTDDFIEWKQVEDKYNELDDKVSKIKGKELTETQYNNILSFMVLALYYLHPPRRNKDYQLCRVVCMCNETPVENLPDNINYICLNTKKFVFNQFKTAKKEGQVVIDISSELFKVIKMYLSYHPQRKEGNNVNIQFLVDYNGNPLNKINDITRLLNKIFGKKVSSSILRNIYPR